MKQEEMLGHASCFRVVAQSITKKDTFHHNACLTFLDPSKGLDSGPGVGHLI